MTASKRRKNHPSSEFHQSPRSSVFCPVSSWARQRETKLANHRRFHYTTNPFPENTYYHRQHHSQTSFSNQLLPQIILRENKGRKPLFGKFSLIDLAGNERGADTRLLEFCRSSYQMSIYEDHLMIMDIVLTISFSALQTGKPEWREPRSTSPFLPSRSV